MRKRYNVFVDGCCLRVQEKHNSIGGWGYLITDEDNNIVHESCGKLRIGDQNSTRAELEALYQCLIYMTEHKRNSEFHIYSDYQAMIDCIAGSSKRASNRDLWDDIEPLFPKLVGRVDISHVSSHVNNGTIYNDFNNYCDKLAKTGANSLLIAPEQI